jgi:hypothetical protein
VYATSAEFLQVIRGSHTAIAKAEVWGEGTKLRDLDVTSGSVRIDARSSVRRTVSINVIADRLDNALVPDDAFDDLAPFGNELRVYRGAVLEDGTEEYVPLGVFVITDLNVTDRLGGVDIVLNGQDRSFKVASNRWLSAYKVTSADLSVVLTNLLQNRWADIQLSFPATTGVTVNDLVLGTDTDNDPWKDAVQIAEDAGYDLFFDPDGFCQLRQFPSLDASVVVATYQENEDATITELDRSISALNTYNGVCFTGESSKSDPIRVEVWDEDPLSPTYRYGKFGQRVLFFSSPVIVTQNAAVSAATSVLNRYLGAQEQVAWRAIVNPAHDANDVIYINNIGAKVNRVIIIDALEVPLDPAGTMSAQARTVRVVDEGQVVD